MQDKNKWNAIADQKPTMADSVINYFMEHGYERTESGKVKVSASKLDYDKRSLLFFSELADALEFGDSRENVKDIFDAIHARKAAETDIVYSLVQAIRSEVFSDMNADEDTILKFVMESICLIPPYQEYLDEPFFVKMQLLHLDVRNSSLEPAEVDSVSLRARNQLCGTIGYESTLVNEEGPFPCFWGLYADISLTDVIRIVHHFRYEDGDSGTIRLPVDTIVMREGHPTQRLTAAMDIPIEQIKVFNVGWYGD